MTDRTKIRNVAIIAHVDHGKTTIVDALLKQSKLFRDNQAEMGQNCIMDSNQLERERGITIMAKNASIHWGGYKINIIDTPGHADFSGEVERTLGMADGAVLIIDAQEGPMPQTRFVLKQAFKLGLSLIVVINKVDKQNARVEVTERKTADLVLEFATEELQLSFPVLYGIGREGKVYREWPADTTKGDIIPLIETIIEKIPAPEGREDEKFLMQVQSLMFDTHLGKMGLGKILHGRVKRGDRLVKISGDKKIAFGVERILVIDGIGRCEVDEAMCGEIVALAGTEAEIGVTISADEAIAAMPDIKIGEPTLHMVVGPNTSPFTGKDGEFTTSRQLENRLERELETNIGLKLSKLDGGKFRMSGLGELHLAVLLETLRREGYEMEVGKPEVIIKDLDGVKCEPVEEVTIVVPEEQVGTVTQELGRRQANLIAMNPREGSEVEFVYRMPTRAILGLRSLLLTATKGMVLFASQFEGFEPMGEPLTRTRRGVIISGENGEALSYGLEAAQQRGVTMVNPGIPVYEGMIVGINSKDEDITMNVTKGKKLTNMRAAAADQTTRITPAQDMSLEQGLDFLEQDELLEVTPKNLRLRKRFLTDLDRRRLRRQG